MGDIAGFLPPEEPHRIPYEYLEDQGAHSTRQMVVPGPEAVILTGRSDAKRILGDVLGLERLPTEVAEEALEEYQAEDGDVEGVIEQWLQDREEEPEDAAEGQAIPEDLEALEYSELQDLAQEHDIAANQSTEDLVEALEGETGG